MNKSVKVLSLALLLSASFVVAEEVSTETTKTVEVVKETECPKKAFKDAAKMHAQSTGEDTLEISDEDVDAFFKDLKEDTEFSKEAIETFVAKLAAASKDKKDKEEAV
ncbi:MAG: CBS-domain-containing membrane protein [Alteromonas naphthalenivorans]|jgi:CBS-domain-containing membrane protein